MNLNVLDVIFILLIILFVIRCYLKGFVEELMSKAAIVLGFYAALFFYRNGAEYLKEKHWPELNIVILNIISFIALLLIVFIIVRLLGGLLKGVIHGIRLGSLDKFLGIIIGIAEGFVVVSLVLFIIKIQPLVDSSLLLSDSIFARIILPLITKTENVSGV